MRLKLIIIFLLLVLNLHILNADINLKFIEKWEHDVEVFGYLFDSYLDRDGELIIMFFKNGIKILNAKSARDLTTIGQGPGEIENWKALYVDQSNIINFEMAGKVILFEKQNGLYRYKETRWIRRNNFLNIEGGVYHKDKFYLTGFSPDREEEANNTQGYFLSIFKEDGKFEKKLFHKDFKGIWRGPYILSSYARLFNNYLYVILASEPELRIYDTNEDILYKIVNLEMPNFYKPIKDYMKFGKYKGLKGFIEYYESWRLSYSRIENLLVTAKNLIINIRTASDKLPKFAVLFYDPIEFSLDDICFSEHLLLAAKQNKFYFLENGDPGLDVEANKLNILVYEYEKNN